MTDGERANELYGKNIITALAGAAKCQIRVLKTETQAVFRRKHVNKEHAACLCGVHKRTRAAAQSAHTALAT